MTQLLGLQDTQQATAAQEAGGGRQQDQVEISQRAKEMQRIAALTEADDPGRAQLVEQIRHAVETGTYTVDGKSVADAVIRHVLTESVL
jgi:flagellar biosynthesis anti-sigma factor FlgM